MYFPTKKLGFKNPLYREILISLILGRAVSSLIIIAGLWIIITNPNIQGLAMITLYLAILGVSFWFWKDSSKNFEYDLTLLKMDACILYCLHKHPSLENNKMHTILYSLNKEMNNEFFPLFLRYPEDIYPSYFKDLVELGFYNIKLIDFQLQSEWIKKIAHHFPLNQKELASLDRKLNFFN